MLVAGRAFDGSTSLLNAYERLTPLAGHTSWFTEFRPAPSFYFHFIERLLIIFFKHHICCHISGSYVTYLAAVTNSFSGVSMYIALWDAPLLNLIFERGGELDTFQVDEFRLMLVHSQSELDIYTYRVSSGDDFSVLLFCFGVDASRICGPRSNVDFVHFMWENFERFNFRKYSLALVPPSFLRFCLIPSLQPVSLSQILQG
jgi:hypothetical protein